LYSTTALARHHLIDDIASTIDVALPRRQRSPRTAGPVTWHRFDEDTFFVGRDQLTVYGDLTVGLYNAARPLDRRRVPPPTSLRRGSGGRRRPPLAGRAREQLYALEGFLDRLSRSPHAQRYVLKGGVLLATFQRTSWVLASWRATAPRPLLATMPVQ
jgi:hypothetical protein